MSPRPLPVLVAVAWRRRKVSRTETPSSPPSLLSPSCTGGPSSYPRRAGSAATANHCERDRALVWCRAGPSRRRVAVAVRRPFPSSWSSPSINVSQSANVGGSVVSCCGGRIGGGRYSPSGPPQPPCPSPGLPRPSVLRGCGCGCGRWGVLPRGEH